MRKPYGKILIFGGAGSLGTELVRFYREQPIEIVVVSRDEAKHWDLKNTFGVKHQTGEYYRHVFGYVPKDVKEFSTLKTLVCDVRDARRVHQVIRDENPQFIIVAQALKQVDTCEAQPSESIDTNILGVRNILDAVEENSHRANNEIETVCFVSTDKAANPINVYGMCKSIAERMVAATAKTSKIKYVTTRYGNVLSSKGSIIPLFQKQALDPKVKAFTVTDPRMTRFMMLLSESVELIDTAMTHGSSGDLWIPKLDSFNVADLANYFSGNYNKPVDIVGIRPGEKIHEILLTEVEDLRLVSNKGCFVINDNNTVRQGDPAEYSSRDHVVSKEVLSTRLRQLLATGTYQKENKNA